MIDFAHLDDIKTPLQAVNQFLAQDASIFFGGCNVFKDEEGVELALRLREVFPLAVLSGYTNETSTIADKACITKVDYYTQRLCHPPYICFPVHSQRAQQACVFRRNYSTTSHSSLPRM